MFLIISFVFFAVTTESIEVYLLEEATTFSLVVNSVVGTQFKFQVHLGPVTDNEPVIIRVTPSGPRTTLDLQVHLGPESDSVEVTVYPGVVSTVNLTVTRSNHTSAVFH
jgi:hypothetical protein